MYERGDYNSSFALRAVELIKSIIQFEIYLIQFYLFQKRHLPCQWELSSLVFSPTDLLRLLLSLFVCLSTSQKKYLQQIYHNDPVFRQRGAHSVDPDKSAPNEAMESILVAMVTSFGCHGN